LLEHLFKQRACLCFLVSGQGGSCFGLWRGDSRSIRRSGCNCRGIGLRGCDGGWRRVGFRHFRGRGCRHGFLFTRESCALNFHFDALDIFLPINFLLGFALLFFG